MRSSLGRAALKSNHELSIQLRDIDAGSDHTDLTPFEDNRLIKPHEETWIDDQRLAFSFNAVDHWYRMSEPPALNPQHVTT